MASIKSVTTEIVLELQQELAEEFLDLLQSKELQPGDFFEGAVRNFIREEKIREMRDAIQNGYIEMAKINLHLASEAFHAEAEANHTVERMVSGG